MNELFVCPVPDANRFVYHYTSLRTALEYILSAGELKFSAFAAVKDPRESKLWSFSVTSQGPDGIGDEDFRQVQDRATAMVKGGCKLLCMSQDEPKSASRGLDPLFRRGFARPRMWAQYGDGHAGVCLVFDRLRLHDQIIGVSPGHVVYAGRVKYVDRAQDFARAFNLQYADIRDGKLAGALQAKVAKHYRTYFLTKAKDWSSEIEWRWVIRGINAGPSVIAEPEYVPIGQSLAGIVLGVDVPAVYDPAIRPLCEKYGVPLTRLSWPNGLPFVTELWSPQ
jgi:hypothetical protein